LLIKTYETPTYIHPRVNTGIYCTNNDKCYFLSIDLKAANYQVLRMYNLVEENTWSGYLAKFIQHPYFSNLKKLRLKILSFADLYPAKQKICWQNIMINILDAIIKNNIMTENSFATFNSDEIIFHTTSDQMGTDKDKCQKFIDKNFYQYQTSIEIFQLRLVSPGKPFFVKINQETDKINWKCISAAALPEAIDIWNNTRSC